MAYDRSKYDDAGKPIGSPNDPLVGIARDQTTGPGGKGLKKREKQSPEEENSSAGETGQGK
jgi:hypothetical protein